MNLRTPFGNATLRRTPIRRKRGRLSVAEAHALRTLGWAALVLVGCILAITLGWDKAMIWLGVLPQEPALEVAAGPVYMTDLNRRPDILFQVFGTREQPRMLPIAVLADGKVKPVMLDSAGWRQFDEMFFRAGKEYTAFADGQAFGSVKVERGMWEADSAQLYTLEGCSSHTPLADVSIVSERRMKSFVLEMLATNASLSAHAAASARREAIPSMERVLPAGEERAFVTDGMLHSLDGRAITVATGVSDAPTVITSWLDSASTVAEDPSAETRHIFLIADRRGDMEYHVTYKHTVEGPLGSAEFRRYLDHLDLTGDGIDEIVLEGWRFGGKTWISVLGFRDGEWKEIFRSRSSWCLDPAPRRRIAPRGGLLSYQADRKPVADR